MENFTYTDIFATKGIEYIVIIGFLILLIPFWIIINRPVVFVSKAQSIIQALSLGAIRFRNELLYSKNYTWAKLENSGLVKIGINDLLLKFLGEVNLNFRLRQGQKVKQGEVIAVLQQGDKQVQIKSPLSGEIVNLNNLVIDSSAIISEDPYQQGWLLAIQPYRWQIEAKSFMTGKKVVNWFGSELQRFRDLIAVSMGTNFHNSPGFALQEGGELKMYPMKEMDKNVWHDFEKLILDQPV
ncbi:MAG TPA: hypothetical protein P5514_11010 [Bacteroidales bacterium]|nr:hypothetical protein [Bacteroidales bacterium]HRX97466.1 hypothetical protein [Bacteroidales bacterium]